MNTVIPVTIAIVTPDGQSFEANVEVSLSIDSSVLLKSLVSAAPVIPPSSKSSGILDNSSLWKAEKDGGTPGTVTSNAMKFLGPDLGRAFTAVQSGKAGFRWSNHFTNNASPMNFCYDLEVEFADPTQIGQLELDMNQVLADGRNCFLCVQFDTNSGTIQYTTTPNNKCHWNSSKLTHNLKSWPPNTSKHIRIFTHRDAAGMVYYDGIEIDEVYQPFGLPPVQSAFVPSPPWPVGTMLINFQTNGANAKGTMQSIAKNIEVFYW